MTYETALNKYGIDQHRFQRRLLTTMMRLSFRPSDYFQVYSAPSLPIRKVSLPLLLSLMRLSGYDGVYFMRWKEHFVEHLYKDNLDGKIFRYLFLNIPD